MIEKFLKVAVEAALESGRIQIASLGKVRRLRFKGEINLVTEVDERCEREILRILRKNFPDHDILSEESGALQKGEMKSDYRWVVDPLDGTTNYSHTYPLFCTSVGLEFRGRPLLGVVYEPNRRELFYAVRGRGAFLNKKRIHVSRQTRLKRSLLSTGFTYDVQKVMNESLRHFRAFLMTSQAVRRDGVAAIDLCYIACGRFDGFWEFGLWPWDTAAGVVILEEAGGKVSRFDGEPFSIYGKKIVASNGRIHPQMLKVLKDGS